ncbi:uncharacterized protein LOC127159163 [Labeo rohita]|uniref:uncharacterized protein LOC127159163 n=1 Tax=Labeo rohita TaxID=84645 RepID=UPI0021E22502|nr:uncharacterized protein LOC127159163 [Labeo rohita]
MFVVFLCEMGNEWSSAEMPRGKGFRRSQAAKRRNAEHFMLSSFMDLAEDMPPLKKKAPTENSETNTCPKSCRSFTWFFPSG